MSGSLGITNIYTSMERDGWGIWSCRIFKAFECQGGSNRQQDEACTQRRGASEWGSEMATPEEKPPEVDGKWRRRLKCEWKTKADGKSGGGGPAQTLIHIWPVKEQAADADSSASPTSWTWRVPPGGCWSPSRPRCRRADSAAARLIPPPGAKCAPAQITDGTAADANAWGCGPSRGCRRSRINILHLAARRKTRAHTQPWMQDSVCGRMENNTSVCCVCFLFSKTKEALSGKHPFLK